MISAALFVFQPFLLAGFVFSDIRKSIRSMKTMKAMKTMKTMKAMKRHQCHGSVSFYRA